MQARENLTSHKQSLMSNSGGSLEAQKADRNVDSDSLAHEGFDGNWARGLLCHIQAMNLAVPCMS